MNYPTPGAGSGGFPLELQGFLGLYVRSPEFPNEPVDKYEQVFAIGGRPITDQPKRLHHVCYRTGDVGFVVVVVWEDEASFAAFGEIIGPATQKVGLDAKPLMYPLHGYMGADGVRNP